MVDAIVVGAGHAGLSTSFELQRRGVEHVVLEAGLVGEAWRSKRWDSFSLNTPSWSLRLPGHAYEGDAPDAFLPRASVVEYLDAYRRKYALPVVERAPVRRLRRDAGDLVVETGAGTWRAPNVIVATGAFHKPHVPPGASGLSSSVFQIHSSEYRRPDQLPAGGVLVVGTGQSGGQIAEDLMAAGRRVHLSAGRCPRLVRRYRGHDIMHWMMQIGFFARTPAMLPSPAAKLACNPLLSGAGGGHDIDLRALARSGARLLGRFEGAEGTTMRFAPDLHETLAKADEFNEKTLTDIDAHIARTGQAAPGETHPPPLPPVPDELTPVRALDLAAAGIGSVIWATGARPDHAWIESPAMGAGSGEPAHERGVTPDAGLFFVGLHFQHMAKSDLFLGVGEDAAFIADRVAERVAGKTP